MRCGYAIWPCRGTAVRIINMIMQYKVGIIAYFPAITAGCRRDLMSVSLEEFSKFIEENRGKRKFKQSVEVAINFKDVDFTKQDNRLNLDVPLPNGKGKTRKVALFANERNMIEAARRNGIEVIDNAGLEAAAKDQKRLSSLLEYDLVAQAGMMPMVARQLGQFLGPRNRMPKPIMPNVSIEEVIKELARSVSIKSKGKYLPTVHSVAGAEDMEPAKVYENVNEIVRAVSAKVGQNNIKSVYVKLTMSKPMRFV